MQLIKLKTNRTQAWRAGVGRRTERDPAGPGAFRPCSTVVNNSRGQFRIFSDAVVRLSDLRRVSCVQYYDSLLEAAGVYSLCFVTRQFIDDFNDEPRISYTTTRIKLSYVETC